MGRSLLERWYQSNKRELPWRDESDPYKIWISEVILQQTRVDQGTNYYFRFLDRFPDVKSLALADEDTVLKMWQGLGYYSRARNLHYSAKYIFNQLNNQFPKSYRELILLKGVGEYIAAAIASIAFNEPVAVVDGNVSRVLSRYFYIEEPINKTSGAKIVKRFANDFLNTKKPGDHNQAMMELGALICTPLNPLCPECPLKKSCIAFDRQAHDMLPVKVKKKKIRMRYFTYYVIISENTLLAEKRNNNDIWQGLYQFPLMESESEIDLEDLMSQEVIDKLPLKGRTDVKYISEKFIHILSHQKINARFVILSGNHTLANHRYTKVKLSQVNKLPFPRLISRFLEDADIAKKTGITL